MDLAASRIAVLLEIRTPSLAPAARPLRTAGRTHETIPRLANLVVAWSELDLAGYRLHRGTSPQFAPGPWSLVSATQVFHVVVPRAADVTLSLYDVRGRRVRTLWQGDLTPGEHVRGWDGLDEHGRGVPNGIYFVRLTDGRNVRVTQVVRVS